MPAGNPVHLLDARPLRHVNGLALRVHRRARQRHPVLPADQPADRAVFGLEDSQRAAVTLPQMRRSV